MGTTRYRFAAIGDLHLDKLGGYVPNQLKLQYKMLEDIMENIQSRGIKRVVLLGDVFDDPDVEQHIVEGIVRFIGRYPDIQWDWDCGNHDKTSADPVKIDMVKVFGELGALPNLRVHTRPTKIDDIGFLPYPHHHPLPGTVLSIAHCDYPGAYRDNGVVVEGDLTKWDLKHQFLIGHNHTPQNHGHVIYPGSPWQNSFGEKTDKYWADVTLEVKDGRIKNYEVKAVPITLRYTLKIAEIKHKRDFKKLDHSKGVWTKLRIAKGILMPSGFLKAHPRCIQDGYVKPKQYPKDEIEAAEKLKAEGPPQDYPEMIDKFLKERGFNKGDRAWALEYVKKQGLLRGIGG